MTRSIIFAPVSQTFVIEPGRGQRHLIARGRWTVQPKQISHSVHKQAKSKLEQLLGQFVLLYITSCRALSRTSGRR